MLFSCIIIVEGLIRKELSIVFIAIDDVKKMLKEFQIANFKSIKDNIFFSMEADDRITEHMDHLVELNNNQLLKIGAIYGPNGGGKSNILKAIELPKFLLEDVYYDYPINLSNIFNDDKAIKGTYFFVNESFEIGYSFEVISKLDLVKEKGFKLSFTFLSEKMSYRQNGTQTFQMLFQTSKAASKSMLFQYADCEVVKNYFLELAKITDLEQATAYNEHYQEIILENKTRLLKAFDALDLKIADIIIHSDAYFPIFLTRNQHGQSRELSLLEESKGTQKMFWILINVLSSLQKDKIFYSDDMNAYLHPQLFKLIVDLYASNQNKRTQLIFNSHEFYNMDSAFLRRDEIWFAYRDNEYVTRLNSLANINNYKGEIVSNKLKYSKEYLNGKFGAMPYLKKESKWYE